MPPRRRERPEAPEPRTRPQEARELPRREQLGPARLARYRAMHGPRRSERGANMKRIATETGVKLRARLGRAGRVSAGAGSRRAAARAARLGMCSGVEALRTGSFFGPAARLARAMSMFVRRLVDRRKLLALVCM